MDNNDVYTHDIPKKRHHGNSIKRIREIIGMKQEVLAQKMETSQQSVSRMEQKEEIDVETLEKVAKALGVTVESILHYSDDLPLYYINTFNNKDNAVNNFMHYNNNNNYYYNNIEPLQDLYERLLKSEKEKVSLLEEILRSKS